jgi:hypothetical protein
MATASDVSTPQHGNWLGSICLATIHLLVFGALYLILVQIFYSFEDHYKLIGYQSTPRFSQITSWSNHIAAYTPIVLAALALDLIIVWRLARRSSRWTSFYSHSILLLMGFIGFLWVAWMITPMVWSRPTVVGPQLVAGQQAEAGQATEIIEPSINAEQQTISDATTAD